MREKRATLKSIAAELGVTHTSISNAYNNPAKISAELRARILAHAARVHYEGPNPAARSLRTGRCGAIGVVFNDQLSYAFADAHDVAFLHGISTICEDDGANIVLIPLQNKNQVKLDRLTAIVDGYILNAPYRNDPGTQTALARGLPTVLVDFDAPGHTSVLTNDRAAMNEMTRHILALGHRQIGIITFPHHAGFEEMFTLDLPLENDNYVVHERMLGCREAIEVGQIEARDVRVCETINSEDGGMNAARRLFEKEPAITALICFSDRLAYGAIAFCRERGLRVPDHVSVTGFDDIPSFDRDPGLPRLTTIRQNAFAKGRKAAEALLRPTGDGARNIHIDATFIAGTSSGAVNRGNAV